MNPEKTRPARAVKIHNKALNPRFLALIAGGAALILVLLLLAVLSSGKGREVLLPQTIAKHVTVGSVEIGGMTREKALQALRAVYPEDCEKTDMILDFPNRKHTLSPADTGAKWDVENVLDRAMECPENTALDIAFLIDEDYIRTKLNTILDALGGVYVASEWQTQGDMPDLQDENSPCQTLVLTRGRSGISLDPDALLQEILDAYRAGQFRVSVKDFGNTLEPQALDLAAILAELAIDPVEPALDRETMTATPGAFGYGFDMEAASALLEEAVPGTTVTLPMERIAPRMADDDVYFQDVLGQCRTPHTDNENRNVNLGIACGVLNGKVLQPGEILSYNEALGKRTTDKGYLPAPAYSGVELVDQIGGGICQVSSTLYLSSLLAELHIVERQNHGFPADYIPIGLDATVNWGTTDLKIQNNREYPVRISAKVEDGFVCIQILGIEDRDYYVRIEHRVEGPRYASAYLCHFDPETDKEIYRTLDHASLYLDTVWQWPDWADNDRIVTYR